MKTNLFVIRISWSFRNWNVWKYIFGPMRLFSILYWSLKDSEQGEGLFGRQQPGDESDAIRKKLLDLVKGSGIA